MGLQEQHLRQTQQRMPAIREADAMRAVGGLSTRE